MILRFHAAVRAALTDTLLRLYALEPAAIPSIVLEAPPTRAMGDLACPVAFELARRLRKAPRAIAAEIVEPEVVATFDPEGVMFWNVNTPDEYERACARAAMA